MERVVFVEVLDRHKHVKERIRINQFPISLGSAYSNNIILEDRYIAPHEAELVCDEFGGISLIARDSVNGIKKLGMIAKLSSYYVESGNSFQLGQTSIRVMFSEHPVAPAQKLNTGLLGISEHSFSLMTLLLTCLLSYSVLALEDYLSLTEVFSLGGFWIELFQNALVFIALAGIWAVCTRLVSHAFRFWLHLSVILSMSVVLTVLLSSLEYIEFLFSPDGNNTTLILSLITFISVTWLFTHLCVVSSSSIRTKMLASVFIGIFGFTMVYIQDINEKQNNNADLIFASTIKAHGADLLFYVDDKTFFEDITQLKSELESESK